MSKKRALIVDDSKTAQLRLRKLLQHYDLEIDLAGSAEEALNYLSYRNPAVIFLDHLMPGMDGFEALKVIKANPHTAMVPVVMYTSKSGDVYMGQARALGAIDVLSKDVIEPSNIEKVMNAISVKPKPAEHEAEHEKEPVVTRSGQYEYVVTPAEQAALPERRPVTESPGAHVAASSQNAAVTAGRAATHASQPAQSAQAPSSHRSDSGGDGQASSGDPIQQVKRHLSRLMEMNTIKIRQEVSDQNRFLFKRMMRELKDLKTIKERQPKEQRPVVEPPPVNEEKPRSIIPDLVIIAVLLIIAFQMWGIRTSQTANDREFQQLQVMLEESNERQRNRLDGQEVLPDHQDAPTAAKLLSTIEWSLNLHNQFEFGDQALGDEKLSVIQELVTRLHAAHFSGVILLSVNHGDFCVLPTTDGNFVLPADETSVENCELYSAHNDDFSLQDQMSLGFVNFLISSPMLSEDGIQIDLKSYGTSRPKFSYPEPTVSAGRWNQVARLNNRVDVSLIPKSAGFSSL